MDSKKDGLRSAGAQAADLDWEAKDEGTKEKGKDNTHNRDLNSKSIFDDPVLCAQFFRDNFDVSLLKEVQPEDIDDISERYLPYLGTEFESDSVKKVRILDIGKERNPPFFVSLIEHKSLVDYDVPMQLLRYMVCIWTEYRREKEAEKEGSTRRKGFRYPIIMPVVYYEGKAKWTADLHLRNRIGDSLRRPEWIPDFRYEVIRIHDYSNRELLNREDEMSLIMLINKIQDTEDLERFIRIPADELDRIVRDSPDHVLNVLVSVMESLCFKIDASAEERSQCVRKVRNRKMGYLFENMEKISIQELRKKTAEEQKRAEEQQRRAEEQQRRAEEQQRRAEEQQRRAEEQQKRAENAEEKLRDAEELIRQLKEQQKNGV
ncbi:MAG: hypothetical protein HFH97_12065 [Lachnospiraceae bacterium]|nr:hypothetical protein [Lachnospiraceae bacterium]